MGVRGQMGFIEMRPPDVFRKLRVVDLEREAE
jgi:hypothetical protein